MKKVYMLLSALMLGAGGVTTAQAQAVQIDGVSYVTKTAKTQTSVQYQGITVSSQVTELSDLTDGGTYLLYNAGRKTFLNEKNGGALWLNKPASLGLDASVEDIANAFSNNVAEANYGNYTSFKVTLKKVEGKDDTYKFQLVSGKFVPTLPKGGGATSSETAGEFEAATGTDGTFTFRDLSGDGTLYFNGNGESAGSAGTFTGWNATGGNSLYKIYKVDGDAETKTGTTTHIYAALEPGKYYNILASRGDAANVGNYSDAQKRWISSESIVANAEGTVEANSSRVIRRTGRTGNPASMLWSFEQNADGTYKIRNANTGLLFGEWVANDTGIEMPINNTNGGNYDLTPVTESETNDQFFLKQNGHMINAYGGLGNNDILADYNGNNTGDGGNFWSFVEATTVPLKIYHDTKWASANYPFAVTLPEGLKAYTVSSVADGKAELAELGTEVPANTAVLIADERQGGEETGDYETFDLTINYGATAAATEGTLLEGTTAARQGFEANASYVLAAGPSLKLTGDVTTIPANKAYLPATAAGTTAQALALHFGEATGIDHATVAPQANQQWYDLQGRRVLYPAKGIFVGQNGKKVLFK